MANEIRLRGNFLRGSITDNPLSSVATTINSAAFANLPVVDTTSHLALTLAPNGIDGNSNVAVPEIVWVTAHTSSSTTVTVIRAREGTTAQSYVTGTVWQHSPTINDYPGQTSAWLGTDVHLWRSSAGNITVDGTWNFANAVVNGAGLNLTGEIKAYAGSTTPGGWLLCDGSVVSRATYSTLFSIIGTTYGAGDGSTTFGLPDGRGRALIGAGIESGSGTTFTLGAKGGTTTHSITIPELPAHTHTASDSGHTHGAASPYQFIIGSIPTSTEFLNAGSNVDHSPAYNVTANPSTATGNANINVSNTGSGTAMSLMQPYTVVNYIIKT